MQIEIPKDAELLAQDLAKAAGFANVDDYIISLIRHREPTPGLHRKQALQKLRELRAQTPKMSKHEIINMVSQARTELP